MIQLWQDSRWRQRCLASATVLLLALAGSAATAADAPAETARGKQKLAAEEERSELQQKLNLLKRDINSTESARSQAAEAVARSEAAISEADRALRDLAGEQDSTEQRLAALTLQSRELKATLEKQRTQLTAMVREHYVAGNEDRTKLLLSGDDPSRINRDLRYLGYVSAAQAKLIEKLQVNLQAIEQNQAEAARASAELKEIASQSQTQKARLEQQKTERTRLLAQFATRLASQRAEAGRLQRDQSRLGGLVEQLGKLIAQQEKAEAAALERRRQQAALALRQKKQEAAAAAAAAAARKARSRATLNPADAIDADEAPVAEKTKIPPRNELIPESEVQESASPKLAFNTLKGRLHLPVRGDLLSRFGTSRNDGPSAKGLFIRAAEGTQVHAVAAGRVVFADWLRGFGNLIIVDHGAQYLTIYGNNQAVLKHPGDNVGSGEVIASVGSTGGNEQSGLYFEMRYQGRPFDPLGWVTIR